MSARKMTLVLMRKFGFGGLGFGEKGLEGMVKCGFILTSGFFEDVDDQRN